MLRPVADNSIPGAAQAKADKPAGGRFAWERASIPFWRQLTENDKDVLWWCAINSDFNTGEIYGGAEKISAELGIGRSRVLRALAKVEGLGLVTKGKASKGRIPTVRYLSIPAETEPGAISTGLSLHPVNRVESDAQPGAICSATGSNLHPTQHIPQHSSQHQQQGAADGGVKAEMQAMGITGRTLDELAAIPGLTPYALRRLYLQASKEGMGCGWIVNALRSGDYTTPGRLDPAEVSAMVRTLHISSVHGHKVTGCTVKHNSSGVYIYDVGGKEVARIAADLLYANRVELTPPRRGRHAVGEVGIEADQPRNSEGVLMNEQHDQNYRQAGPIPCLNDPEILVSSNMTETFGDDEPFDDTDRDPAGTVRGQEHGRYERVDRHIRDSSRDGTCPQPCPPVPQEGPAGRWAEVYRHQGGAIGGDQEKP